MTDSTAHSERGILPSAPLLPAAMGLIGGITFDRTVSISLFGYGAVFLMVATAMAVARRRWGALVPAACVTLAAACVGGALHYRASRMVPPTSIERYAGDVRRLARVRGKIASEPAILKRPEHAFSRWTFGTDRTAFLLDVSAIEGITGEIPASGTMRVSVDEVVLDLHENDSVEVFGWLFRYREPRNPGSFDWATFYRRQGVVAGLRCQYREAVQRLDADVPAASPFLSYVRSTVRGWLTADLATGAAEESSLFEAMVLGHRSRLDRRLNEVFVRAGCIHFLAVSGTHLVVVMSFVWLIGRPLLGSKRRTAVLMAAVVCAYAIIAEARPPILRASIMALLFCLSLILRRPHARLNWIAAAAVILLIIDPTGLFDVGFQLSFAAVLGVGFITPAILCAGTSLRGAIDRHVFRRPYAAQDRAIIARSVRRSLLRVAVRRMIYGLFVVAPAVSLGAWLAGMPIIAWHFHQVHPWAALSSVIVFPLVYVVMILGVVKLMVTSVLAEAGAVVGWMLGPIGTLLIRLVEGLADLPGAMLSVRSPSIPLLSLFYGFLVLFIAGVRRERRRRAPDPAITDEPNATHIEPAGDGSYRRRNFTVAGLIVLFLLVAVGTVEYGFDRRTQRLTITSLAVGAGSATVVELPEGQTILVDAGSSGPYDVARSTIVPFLHERGVRRIDRVYISHPNLDHYNALPALVDEFRTGPIFVNEYFHARSTERSPSRHLLSLLRKAGHAVRIIEPSETVWEYGGVRFEHLWPVSGLDDAVSTNDTSSVLRLSYAGRSILLTGDIEEHGLASLLAPGAPQADVLVLPHHGGVVSNTAAFIRAVGARHLIRSSHERTDETINGVDQAAQDTPLWNTADVGAVQVAIDADGVHVSAPCRAHAH